NLPIKYLRYFDGNENKFKPLEIKSSGRVNVIIKSALDVNYNIPQSLKKLEDDIPDFIVTKNGVIQISPLFYTSNRRPPLMNSDSKDIYNESILVYCFIPVGYTIKGKPIEKNLVNLLAYLKHYYEKLNGLKVNFYRYLPDIEFAKLNSGKDLVVYSTPNRVYTLSSIRAFEEPVRPTDNHHAVGLTMCCECVSKIAESLGVSEQRIIIYSTFRTDKKQRQIYASRPTDKAVYTSFHLRGRAIDFVINNMSSNAVAMHIYDKRVANLRKIIRESKTGTIDSAILVNDLGWIHLELNDYDITNIIENDDYFKRHIIDPSVLNNAAPNYGTVSEAEVIDTDIKELWYDIGTLVENMSSNEFLVERSKNRIEFYALIFSSGQKKKFFEQGRESIGQIARHISVSAAVNNLNKMYQKAVSSSASVARAVKTKIRSYSSFNCFYVYNYLNDEWEKIG
ncbi:MAG: hypothetical protein QXQ43_00590, partial [Nitrososphaerota archaeon]